MTLIQKNMTLIYQKKNKLGIVFTALIVVCVFLTPFFALAQTTLSLSVSPTIFQMTANPGQVWESSLRVINNNSYEITVYAEVVNFRPLGEGGASQFIPIGAGDSPESTLAEWISVPSTALVIPPETTQEIPIIIELPDEVPPGGHYAAVLVGTRPPESRQGASKVETAQVVSSLVFLRVSGDVIEEGRIRSFRTLNSFVESPEATFELRFENTGNVHLRPEGEITIYNMWGQERGTIPVNQRTLFGNVLSDSIRGFTFTWKGEWSPADIGRYSAEAVLAYGEDERKFTHADTHFWVIPWRILFAIFLTLGTIGFLIVWLIKLYVRRMLALAGLNNEFTATPDTPVQRKREISIVAPIEAGILDLRSRFSNKQTSSLDTIFRFIVEYKIFFIGLLIVIISLYLLVWFVSTVSEDDRAFEVTISREGENITVDSESLQYAEQQSDSTAPKKDFPPIKLINRSGVNGAAADVALALEDLGYTIYSVSTELDAVEEKTVIIHDPTISESVLNLSAVLNNALSSPYTSSESENNIVTVYVGTDLTK